MPKFEKSGGAKTKKVKLARKVLEKNDVIAAKLRGSLKKQGIVALNFISSPGSGKTYLLEKTLKALKDSLKCGVLVGDQETNNDAKRLSGKGARVKQIRTGNTCHLNADDVASVVKDVVGADTDLLIIENIGNLICPAVFDLGEDQKVVLLSVTEGEDKPLKYPTVFSLADVVIITKIDLAPHVQWKRKACLSNLKKIAPQARVFETSAKSGKGMSEWCNYLRQLVSSAK
ncbi:MAG: hydrogenase nickel incorporation protein HypB [SAR324 cluster bacterium]|uniref:Hydrogenase nickel incorporation protein HypB n=1 Tax=SAR324 cluster bacterium TaxID=2024889 RepID=A0A7X9FSB7_9DELT|nr:hydrogenase nickel incorporation protein HypB [SAR324 cluster bacterium]